MKERTATTELKPGQRITRGELFGVEDLFGTYCSDSRDMFEKRIVSVL